ncbi:MAG: hypothetical protein AYK19_04475 [Theionarchaea archaeon DG-70-1]|nr:MAG: hypothetical protein AYK19_04475 [Theionarchaea archaeon DG-70-1]
MQNGNTLSDIANKYPDLYEDLIATLKFSIFEEQSPRQLEDFRLDLSYCEKNPSLRPLLAVIRYLLVRQNGIKWLDLGCGSGRALCCLLCIEDLVKTGASVEYAGIDTNKDYLDVAEKTWGSYRSEKGINIKFSRGNIQKIIQKKRSFDLVSCINVLHELGNQHLILDTFDTILSSVNDEGVVYLFEPQYPPVKESKILTWKKEDVDLILNRMSYQGDIHSQSFSASFRDFYYFILESPHEHSLPECPFCATTDILKKKTESAYKENSLLQEDIQTILSSISKENLEKKRFFNYKLDPLLKLWKFESNRHDILEIDSLLRKIRDIEKQGSCELAVDMYIRGIQLNEIKESILMAHDPCIWEDLEKSIKEVPKILEEEV